MKKIGFILQAFLGDVTPNEIKLLVNCILTEDLFSAGCHKAKTKFILSAWVNETQDVSLTNNHRNVLRWWLGEQSKEQSLAETFKVRLLI